jgi:4-amino-4-deoxy-L-arabinose transferase-like glycosyltransferase
VTPYLKTTLLITLTAILLRGIVLLAVVAHPERLSLPDTGSYLRPALNLLTGHGFSQREEPPFVPDASRTPVYPLFIALLYGLFGQQPLIIVGVQILVSALTCGLTYLLGVQLLPERGARLGGLLLTFSLGSIVYSFYILTETLFTVLLLGMAYGLAAYWHKAQARWLAVGGLLMGAAILCRPIALFYPLVVSPLAGVVHRDRLLKFPLGLLRQGIAAALLLLGATGLVVAPWLVRNQRLLGLLTVSTVTSYNLFFHGAVPLGAHLQGMNQNQLRAEMADRVQAELARRGESDEASRVKLYNEWSRQIILAHPLRYLYVHLRSDLNSLLPNITEFLELLGITQGGKGTLSVLNRYGLWAAVHQYFGRRMWLPWFLLPLIALLGLTYVGMLVGTVALARRQVCFSLAVLLLPIVYFLLVPGVLSHPRFRVPVMPYICLLAGIGLDVLGQRVHQRLPVFPGERLGLPFWTS